MGLFLLHVILVILLFELSTENPIYSYRFEVYPVDKCPMNSSEFETAAKRRNCTKGTRYLCAPDKYLSNLIEFCTDVTKSLYGEGNCVRLEGTGGLNHYNCVDTFISGCLTSSYTDDNIYKYPACLDINKDLKCFVAEKDCLERISPTAPSSTERYFNETKREGSRNNQTNGSNNAAVIIVIVLSVVLLGVVISILGILFYKKRKKKKEIPLDEKKLREFLSKGDLTIRQVRCIIVGCAGAGKTTLLKRLQNVPYKELKKIETTEMVDVHVNSFEVLEDKETIKSVGRKNELPTIIFSTDMLEINSKRMHIEQTPVDEKDYTEDGESSEDEHSKRSENDAILENKDSASDKSSDKTARSRRKQTMSSNAKRKLEFYENNEEESVESEHDEETSESIRLIPFSTCEQGKDTNQREDIENIVLPQCSSDKTSLKGKTDSFQSLSQASHEGNDIYIGSEGRIETENKEDNVNSKFLTSPETSGEYTTEKQHDGTAKDIETKTDCDDQDDNEKYALLKIMDAVKQLSSESNLRPRITFLDFAGQSVYYAFHQIYLSPKTCYILVVDMSKRFDEQVHVLDSDEIGCSRFESWTYQDYYNFWLTSIDSFSDTKTPVILVGTHAENKSMEECRKFFRGFFAKYDQHPHLRRHLHEDRRYAIGFPKKGSKLEDLVQIKTCIARLVQDPEYSEKHIRPVWTIFEQILQREKTRRIISRDTLSNYNKRLSKEFRMNDSEITEMLLFLHRVGNLLYFDEDSLKEIIILDIQWLVDAFKCIVTYKVKIANTDIKRSHFQITGEIEDKELREIWENQGEKGKTFLSHKTDILSCMEQLGLLATCGAEKYYIPSMNKRKFENDDGAYLTSSILCFQFDKDRQSPLDLFYGVILKCLKIPEWSILQAREQNCFYENVACFSFRQYIVVVCLCKFQIQVQVRIPGKTGSIPTEILGEVQRSVEEKIGDYKKYWYEIGYKCQNGMLNAEDDNSFIAKEKFPVSKVICEKCKFKDKHYVDNKICWIPTKEETIKGDDQDEQPVDSTKETSVAGEETLEDQIKDILEATEEDHTEKKPEITSERKEDAETQPEIAATESEKSKEKDIENVKEKEEEAVKEAADNEESAKDNSNPKEVEIQTESDKVVENITENTEVEKTESSSVMEGEKEPVAVATKGEQAVAEVKEEKKEEEKTEEQKKEENSEEKGNEQSEKKPEEESKEVADQKKEEEEKQKAEEERLKKEEEERKKMEEEEEERKRKEAEEEERKRKEEEEQKQKEEEEKKQKEAKEEKRKKEEEEQKLKEEEERRLKEEEERKQREAEEEERKKKEEEEKLESTLSNQNADKETMKSLIEENVKLKEDMEKMKGEYKLIKDKDSKISQVEKENQEKSEQIKKLEVELEKLKVQVSNGTGSEGSAQKISDLEKKLIRLAKEDEEKDKQITSLNKELQQTKTELQKMERGAPAEGGNQPSKSCVIL